MRSEVVKFKTLDGLTTYNSVNDWNMRLLHCDEQKPLPKFKRVDVPGANGSIDLSTALTNDIPFEDREIDLTFFKLCSDHSAAYTLANTVASRIHGKQLFIQTPDSYASGDTWYTGDVEITSCVFDDSGCEINVHAVCDPFRIASSGGSLSLSPSVRSTVTTGSKLASVNAGDLDSNGLEFVFEYPGSGGWTNHSAVAATFASGVNLFDMNLTNVRLKTCKTNESWKNSGKMRQDGQKIVYGAVADTWVERAVFTATNATDNIDSQVFPFVENTHIYLFLESETVTATGNVTYDGYSYSPGVRIKKVGQLNGSIGASGEQNSGSSSEISVAAPAVGQNYSTIVDCGTASAMLGQIIVDVVGITAANVTIQIMFVEEGSTAPTVFEEPLIQQIIVPMNTVMVRNGVNTYDAYYSMMPRGYVDKGSGVEVETQSIQEWPRDAIYVDFSAVDDSGWLIFRPRYEVEIYDWPIHTATITNGTMPTYPLVTTDANGAVIEYSSNINVVSPNATDAELPTLLQSGSNTISYTLPGDAGASASMKWSKGEL